MLTFLQFALLGLGAGAAYALLAQGLVLIHRGSGVVNFSHGAMALVGALMFYEMREVRGTPLVTALVVAVLAIALIGALVYVVVMRPLLYRSGLSKIIATLGLLIIFQGVGTLIWGELPKPVADIFPEQLVHLGPIAIGGDRFYLFGVGLIVTVLLWAFLKYSRLGVALRANAENPVAASALGWSPHSMGVLTWSLGAGLAGLAGILIAPLTGIAVDQMPLLVIPALAAAMLGRFRSFPITLVVAILIGVVQSLATRYAPIPGIAESVPFLLILAILVFGRTMHERRQEAAVLPAIGTGELRPIAIIVTVLVASALMFVLPIEFVHAVTASMSWALIMLSVVLLLGYTGQISLAQMALAGIGALVAGRLVSSLDMPFAFASLLGVLVAIPVGLVFALPALRTKGANLAVVTLGLAVTTSAMIFNNAVFTGGAEGTPVGYPDIFGFEIDATMHPERYAILVILFFTLCALIVTNVRRGSSGRRLIAVRTNERAASALGVNVLTAKLFAFALAAGIAAVGGILAGFRNPYILFNEFAPLNSILLVAFTVVGGIGFIFGPVLGGTLAAGGIGAWILHLLFPTASPVWLHIISGLMVTIVVVAIPNGLVVDQIKAAQKISRLWYRRTKDDAEEANSDYVTAEKVEPKAITVEDVTVRFGGVTANKEISLDIRPGEVLGLIGPNGAGKTTLIDAVTGFVRPSEGSVRIGGHDITRLPVHERTRLGVSRSFQALELFESSTVRENLRVASDPRGLGTYLRDILWTKNYPLSPAGLDAIKLLGLQDDLDTVVEDMPYGRRRLVAIARAVAASPSVLLLDEPAAGLSAEETSALVDVVRDLAENWGIAILVVEHDMSFVMTVCDRITVLDFGRQIGFGTPEEIRNNPAVVAAYLGAAQEDSAATNPVALSAKA